MGKNEFPGGWNEEGLRRVLTYYDEQTEEEAVLEDEGIAKRDREPYGAEI
jgi:hypothetical protein